jgi:molybdopterin-guanine dinucleotide biosynthesis protein A
MLEKSAMSNNPTLAVAVLADAIYRRGCAGAIRERLDGGERHAAVPPRGVTVTEIGPDELAASDPEGLLFVNVNTPHDTRRPTDTRPGWNARCYHG